MRTTRSSNVLPANLLERMASALRVLAHPLRLRLVELLEGRPGVPVHALVKAVGLPQAAVSQHLNQMKRSGLLRADRRGKEVWYSVADASALTILDCIRSKHGGRT